MSQDLDIIRTELAGGRKIFLLHSNADMDCVGGSVALALFYGNSTLAAPGGVSHLGKRLLENIQMEIDACQDTSSGERFFVLDAQDDSSIGYPGVQWEKTIVIDHHRSNGKCRAQHSFIDGTAASCCELVWEVIGRPEKLERAVGLCLMAGILADTGYLKRGDSRTLMAAAEILKASGLVMEDVRFAFESAEDQDISRRVSRLKGVQRMRFERVGEWVVATSEIGAFESAVCHALLSVGADIALIGSQKENEFRITGRATRQATESGVHLGEIFNRIAGECGGEGGGHDGAAGFSGEGDVEAMLSVCSQNVLEKLKGKPRHKRPE